MVWGCKPLLVRYSVKPTKKCSYLSMTVSIRKGGVSHVLATTTKQIISSFLVTSSCSFIYSYTHVLQGFYTFMYLPPEIYTVHDYHNNKLKGHVVDGLFNKLTSTLHVHTIILWKWFRMIFPMILHLIIHKAAVSSVLVYIYSSDCTCVYTGILCLFHVFKIIRYLRAIFM